MYLTGHHIDPVATLAERITSSGGTAEAFDVDALDEQAVNTHLDHVITVAGRIDISFNAISIDYRQGAPCPS